MKLTSKYFDSIRVKKSEDRTVKQEIPQCNWKGCTKPGEHRAPKGRNREGEYYNFCLEHVRAYNKNYNYFSGMSDEQVSDYQESALTGHRPTWKLGVNKAGTPDTEDTATTNNKSKNAYDYDFESEDAFDLFNDTKAQKTSQSETKRRRPVRKLERKNLRTLNLDDNATAEDIKTKFKDLVKKHHPDLNGGDRSSEDRLREIIQAYNYLKQVGLC